jgi:hypothetical protein
LTLSNSSASIYSTKTSYTDTTNGWYLGWKSGGGGSYTPAIYLGGADTYLKYSTDLGLEIKGNVSATTGSIGGWTIGTDSIYKGSISLNSATGTVSGATISGGTVTGTTISGSTLTTSGSGFGRIRLNSSVNTLEFLTDTDLVAGALYQFNGGSELILQHGNKTSLGYPSSSHYISLNSVGVTLGRTNAAGSNIGGLTVNSTDATFNSVNVQTYQGAPIGTYNYYMRNIGMGTGAKTTTDTDGVRGDIWIQYA